ncbi:MAG: hypothetical protein ACXWT3_07315 [Methylococcaceae bacterium]
MAHDTDKMNEQLDVQLVELEKRFNQFLKDLEEDFNFVPSAIANQQDNQFKDFGSPLKSDPRIDHRFEDIEKRYDMVDRRYKIMLFLTSSITIGIFAYLGYKLFN